MTRINIIEPAEATGRLKEIYDIILRERGKLADIHKIQSMHPESIMKHIDLYLEIMFSKSPLSRDEREMMAVIVSKSNGCDYCVQHHVQALQHYWKKHEKIQNLIRDYNSANLSASEKLLCEFAKHLTLFPGEHEKTDYTIKLKNAGFTDEAILDATLVIAYFNFVNRIALSLGLETANNEVRGYHY